MIVVREVFHAKPGMASKLAKMFKEMIPDEMGQRYKIMTDMTGPFNQVVMEGEYEDLAAFEKDMQEYMSQQSNQKPDPSKPSHVDMYVSGKREIFRVW
jgi:hypothetical protein